MTARRPARVRAASCRPVARSSRRSSPRRILPVTSHRQLLDERDGARILVRSEALAHERLQLPGELVARDRPRGRHDVRLHDLAALRVGCADHGRQRDRGMADEALLDLARPDAVPGARDHVVVPAHEAEVAVGVLLGLVAGVEPAVPDLGRRRLLVAPVAEEHDRIAVDANADLAADDAHIVSRVGEPHRPGARLPRASSSRRGGSPPSARRTRSAAPRAGRGTTPPSRRPPSPLRSRLSAARPRDPCRAAASAAAPSPA